MEPDPERVRELHRLLDGALVTPIMYPMILDIVDGRHVLMPCVCRLVEAVRPAPLVQVDVPLDYRDPAPTFASFNVVNINQVAFEVCRGWARAFVAGKYLPGPILCGPVGIGKTRLLWTIMSEIAAGISASNEALYVGARRAAEAQEVSDPVPPYRRLSWRHLSVPRFAEAVRLKAISHQDVVEYRRELANVDILAIDDIGAENATELVREQFYLLVEDRVTARKPMLVACNFTAQELETWAGSRVYSRLMGACELVQYSTSDKRTAEKARRIKGVSLRKDV